MVGADVCLAVRFLPVDSSISDMVAPAKVQLYSELPVDFNFTMYLSDVYAQAVVKLVTLEWPAWLCVQGKPACCDLVVTALLPSLVPVPNNWCCQRFFCWCGRRMCCRRTTSRPWPVSATSL